MKHFRRLAAVCCALAALGCARAFALEMTLESVRAQLTFPDSWLVVTPAGLPVYKVILEEAGFDYAAMEARFASDGIVAEGWNETWDDSYRLLVTADERSERIFDIGRATTGQRKTILNSFLDKTQWRLTNRRYTDGEWVTHKSQGRFLLLRYNVLEGEDIVERGVQYFTIRNGQNYVLDWTLKSRRFSNRDLAYFKDIWNSFRFTEQLPAPPLPVSLTLENGLPSETGDGQIRITGTTDARAGLVLSHTQHEGDEPVVLSVGSANSDGTFTLNCALPAEGVYMLTLTATREGSLDTSVSHVLSYQKGVVPVNFDALPGDTWTENTLTLSGWTLGGTELQLLDKQGGHNDKVGRNGRFSFTVDTSLPGMYRLVLVVNQKGYKERRIEMNFERPRSEEHDAQDIREDAEAVSYNKLVKQPEEYVGKALVFTGTVLECTEGNGAWFVRINVSPARGGNWPLVLMCEANPDLADGQKITFYGQANSPFTEQDDQGQETVIPSLTYLWIDKP